MRVAPEIVLTSEGACRHRFGWDGNLVVGE